jgi:uncharacterized membrane protein YhaH (DUF805 family)
VSELDGIVALLILVAVGLVWVAFEVKRLRDAIEPIASSRLVGALSRA